MQSTPISLQITALFGRPGVVQLRQWVRHYGARTVFLLGLLLYITLQLRLVLIPILNRSVPVEADDAYTYIIKAAEMESCFLQDCPALVDLRKQLVETTPHEQTTWLRYREYSRAFVVYHPLHSLIMVGLHKTGLTWEAAYNVITITGVIFIGLAIGYLLYVLWGPLVAGIALAGLSINLFPGQGLHYIVPSNLSLGIAIFTWAAIIHKKDGARWIMLAGILAMITMHTTGRLYALIALALFWILTGGRWPWRMPRQSMIAAGLGLLLVALSFGLPLIISRPDLLVRPDPLPPDWQPRQGLYNNITTAIGMVISWCASLGGWWITGLLVLAGFFFTPRPRLKPVLVLFILLGAVTTATLFYVLPRYPAEAFGRIWVAFAILLMGLIAQAFTGWVAMLSDWLWAVIQHGIPPLFRHKWILSIQGWTLVGLVVLGAAFLSALFVGIPSGARAMALTAGIMTEKQNNSLDPAQPALLLSKGCGRVVYMDEVPMHFYFSRGALECGAVYYPAVEKTADRKLWLSNKKDARYLVAWNPSVASGRITGGNNLALAAGDQLAIDSLAARPLNSISIYVENPGPDVTVTAQATGPSTPGATEIRWQVPAHSSTWLKIAGQNSFPVTGITLTMPADSAPIRINGLRLDPDSKLNWPWDKGVSLVYKPADPSAIPTTITFDSNALAPALGPPLHILADNGDTVLAEFDK
jgi:hypothetical protein